jgi:hypothetical protein
MKKFVLKSILYFFVLLVIANALAFLGAITLKRSQFFKPAFMVNAFKPRESFHIAVFGSSRSLAAIDTKAISNELGGLSVNFSMDYTALPTTKLMLEHFYGQGFKAEYVVISLDLPDMDSSKTVLSENDYRFLPFINEPYVKEYYGKYDEGILKPLASSKYFPFLGFGYYNMELLGPALVAAVNPAYKYQFDDLGNFQYPDFLSIKEKPEIRRIQTNLTNPILKQIQELTDSHSSKLIVYIAPYLRDEIMVSKATPYLLINHAQLISEPKYFSDYIHVVNSGKEKATEAFIVELQKLN